jgi:hypothetical protein
MPDDRGVVRLHRAAELAIRGDGIDGEPDMPRPVHEVFVRARELVVVAVVPRVLKRGDDVAVLHQMGADLPIDEVRTAVSVGNHDERELAFRDRSVGAYVEGIWPKGSGHGRNGGRIQDEDRKRDALGLVCDTHLAATNEHMQVLSC